MLVVVLHPAQIQFPSWSVRDIYCAANGYWPTGKSVLEGGDGTCDEFLAYEDATAQNFWTGGLLNIVFPITAVGPSIAIANVAPLVVKLSCRVDWVLPLVSIEFVFEAKKCTEEQEDLRKQSVEGKGFKAFANRQASGLAMLFGRSKCGGGKSVRSVDTTDASRRIRGDPVQPDAASRMIFGAEFALSDIGALLRGLLRPPGATEDVMSFGDGSVGITGIVDSLATAIEELSVSANIGIGFTVATADFAAGDPVVPQLPSLEGVDIFRGLTLSMKMTLVDCGGAEHCDGEIPQCGSDASFCKFVHSYLDVTPDFFLRFYITLARSGVSFGAGLGGIVLYRNDCQRVIPYLDSVYLDVRLAREPRIKLAAAFDVDVGVLEEADKDGCVADVAANKFVRPLRFELAIVLTPKYLKFSAFMRGLWARAFGLDFLHFAMIGLELSVLFVKPSFEFAMGTKVCL